MNKDKSDSEQLILLAHGSRDSNWCDTFESGLEVINSYLQEGACLAYMEMAAPSLESVIATHYLSGVRKFNILPLFFAAGRHLLHDVPTQLEQLQSEHEGVEITLLEAVGRQGEFWHALGAMIANKNTEPDTSTLKIHRK
ncbi:MAG: sirohydrochlorin cobaltochelatase [Pseudohongiellaceae bacterium]